MAEQAVIAAKKSLRLEALSRRDALAPDYRASAAETVAESWRDIPINGTETLSAFLPIRSEIDLRHLVERLRTRVADVVLPVVIGRRDLEFRRWVEGADLVDAGFGTIGPPPTATVIDPDLMLVPLAAYDRTGGRIGYGAGHYDRAIARISVDKPVLCIGAAFAAQEVERVPMEPHDRRLDMMLTEEGLLWCK